MTPAIFVNHRNVDTAWATYLDRQLATWCGPDQIFRASRSIRLGQTYPDELIEKARSARVMVVVIGPGWDAVVGQDGNRPVDHEHDDWVRREIATALAHDVTVIPVLVGGADLPRDLPADISGVTLRRPLRLDHRNDDEAFTELLGDLIHILPEGVVRTPAPVARLLASTLRLALAVLVIMGLAGAASAGTAFLLTRPEPALIAEDRRWDLDTEPGDMASGTSRWGWDLDQHRQTDVGPEIDLSIVCFPRDRTCSPGEERTFAVSWKAGKAAAVTPPVPGRPADCLGMEYPGDAQARSVPVVVGSELCVRSPTRVAHLTFIRVPDAEATRLTFEFRSQIWKRP